MKLDWAGQRSNTFSGNYVSLKLPHMDLLRWLRDKVAQDIRFHGTPKPWDSLVFNAQSHIKRERYDEARAVLLQALKFRDTMKNSATIDWVLESLGDTWLLTEEYGEGIRFFSDYIDSYSEDAAAYRERASIRWYAGQLDEAIEDYSRALELKEGDVVSLSGRGQVLAEVGQGVNAINDLDLALQEIKTAPKSDPTWIEWYKDLEAFVHNGRGAALAALGEIAPAMNAFERSIAMCPENAWVYYNRAHVHDLARDFRNAHADYQTALAKKRPPLNPIRKSRAEARLREMRSN
jgi:tetratricopeptide (TPR) repeat protein